jgi:hypothetical protein
LIAGRDSGFDKMIDSFSGIGRLLKSFLVLIDWSNVRQMMRTHELDNGVTHEPFWVGS